MLLTASHSCSACPDEVAIPKITTVLKMLPMGHRVTIKYLARFLRDVCAASDINKMTPSNVAIVFAPNLLKPPGNDVMAQIDDTPYSNKLMQMFVINYDTLFAVRRATAWSISPAAVTDRAG